MLVSNWRAVLARAWSIRLILLAGVLTGLEAVLTFVGSSLPIPPGLLALIACLVTGGAFVARLIAQKGISDE